MTAHANKLTEIRHFDHMQHQASISSDKTPSDKTPSDKTSSDKTALINEYLRLTREVMPTIAATQKASATKLNWPVHFDHCFQRIVLDNVCQGAWYDYLPSPAYLHLTTQQANDAVGLCVDIIANRVDIHVLNQRSLGWRKNIQQAFSF